jgi:hypothetical protein
MLEAIDTYGREIKPGDIVMSYGEFLIYSHQTEKRLMCKRPGSIFSPFTWVQKTNYNLVKFVPELGPEFLDRMREAEVEYEDYQREKLMPGRDW